MVAHIAVACAFSFAALAVAVVALSGRMIALLVAAACLGFALGGAHACLVHSRAHALETACGPMQIELLEDSVDSGYGERALVRLSTAAIEGVVATAEWDADTAALAGERFDVVGTFEPADFASDEYAWRRGSSGRLKARELEKKDAPFVVEALVRVRASAIAAVGAHDDAHRLLQALVCGYRRDIRGTEAYSRFQTCGLAHLVAVSGAHLVIVTGIVASLLKVLRLPRRLMVVFLGSAMGLYLVFAGMPVSALRAAIMSALGLFAYFGKRRASSLNAVGVGVFAIVGAEPAASLSASFTLSALSTVGIVLFSPLVTSWLGQTPLSGAPGLAEPLSLTLSAALLSQLYAGSLFNQLPLVSPAANVVCAPLLPLACGLGLVGALVGTLVPALAAAAIAPAACAASALGYLATFMAKLPYASVPFAIDTWQALALSSVCSLLVWSLWPRRVRAVAAFACSLAVAVVVAFAVTGDPSDKIVMLDVGQGDAFLVQSQGKSLLIDTGNQDTRLLGQIARCRTVHLDAVLITHADDDHCGSLDALRGSVAVDRVIVAQDMLSCEGDAARSLVNEARLTGKEVIGMGQGDTFTMGAFNVRAVWPGDFKDEGGNADSLCVLLAYDGDADGEDDALSFMTGDAEKDEISSMIDAGLVGHVDVLKVGHHGSRNGMTADELEVLSPEIALISCGLNNRYGHPAQETLDMLDEVGATVFRTDLVGSVKCVFNGDGVSVA